MTSKHHIGVFIGRFEPFHTEHARQIDEALKHAELVLVLIGSAYQARSVRNPFTEKEREQMILAHYANNPRVHVAFVQDSNYNVSAWIERVYTTVNTWWSKMRNEFLNNEHPNIALIGHNKDSSSYYLDFFPSWNLISTESTHPLSATSVREKIFSDATVDFNEKGWAEDFLRQARANATNYLRAANDVPKATVDFLLRFIDTKDYDTVAMEFAARAKYCWQWRHAPHTPMFYTGDACVIQSGHILLVKRDHYPGKGLWSMPGGFVKEDEVAKTTMLRELKDKTGIKVPPSVISGHIIKDQLFEDPHRSSRGRTVTRAFLVDLGTGALPKIKNSGAQDEAEKVKWVKLSDLDSSKLFEDHYQIVRNLTQMF